MGVSSVLDYSFCIIIIRFFSLFQNLNDRKKKAAAEKRSMEEEFEENKEQLEVNDRLLCCYPFNKEAILFLCTL